MVPSNRVIYIEKFDDTYPDLVILHIRRYLMAVS